VLHVLTLDWAALTAFATLACVTAFDLNAAARAACPFVLTIEAISMPIHVSVSTPSTVDRPQPIGFRGSDSGTFLLVATQERRQRDLTDAENEHVRRLVRELLKRDGVTQINLAPRIGLKQPALSGFLGERQGTSRSVAHRAAKIAGVDVEDVLAGRPVHPDPYANRARAMTLLSVDVHAEALDFVRKMAPKNGDDMTVKDWVRVLLYWDEQARAGRMP
jgi:hypothetical protein